MIQIKESPLFLKALKTEPKLLLPLAYTLEETARVKT